MESRRILWLVVGFAGGCLFFSASASNAQVRRYEPSRPTVSPYLNLFREQRSPIPNYYTLVRPFQNQYQVNQQQQQYMQRQNQAIQQLQYDVQSLEQTQQGRRGVAPTGSGSWFNQPGTRNTYMNTYRYYPPPGGIPAR
jgi:hypothetical protein